MSGGEQLLVLGTTEFAVEIAEIAEETGFDVTGFVENLSRAKCEAELEGRPVYWIDDVVKLSETHVAVCGLGTTHRRAFVEQASANGLRFATLVHPTARVPGSATLGEGTIVSAGVVIGAKAGLGRHVLLNRGVLVGHHTKVDDYVSIMPGATVAGSCVLEEAAFVATGAVVVDHVRVGTGSILGAGAVVIDDVPAHVQVVGVPAKVVKEGIGAR